MDVLANYTDDQLKAEYPGRYAARIAKRELAKTRLEEATGRLQRKEARKLRVAADAQRKQTCATVMQALNTLRPMQMIQSRDRSLLATVLSVKVTEENRDSLSLDLFKVLDGIQQSLDKQQAIIDRVTGALLLDETSLAN